MIVSRPLDDFRIYDRHHRGESLPFDRNYPYEQHVSSKPNGLWVSVQDDWDRWCTANEMGWTDDVQVYKVHVRTLEALLLITNVDELDEFTRKYSARTVWPRRLGDYINWPAVAAEYSGIVIYPYLYDWMRDSAPWHYAWDVASGCIWDLSLVRAITPIFHTKDLGR